ncbi:glycosyltransferase family 61 protein [Nostoc sp. PA-18-2419]|uniref:glycosyltransferase family 61 protein n=1 Tax=Nostoc sp. PA-18-2419 TaxID=2575443 RepID=UPI001108CC67|nr:glycosyltransferase family 61 protein [Nostoc sp. PA-18-2419]
MFSSQIKNNLINQSLWQIFIIIGKLLRSSSREQLLLPLILKILKIRIVTNSELRADDDKHYTIAFGNTEYIKTGNSYVVGETPIGIKDRSNQEFTLFKPWISEVNNAELIGSKAVGFNEDGNIISPSTLPPKEYLNHRFEGGLPIITLFIKTIPEFKSIQFDTVCSLVNHWSKNYYHWIVDCLTRIEGVEYYQQQTGYQPLLIINSHPTSWQIESLKLLGYQPEDYIEWNISKAKVKKLIVPSFRRQGEWVAPSSLYWLRQRILSNLPISKGNQISYSPNIYISRAKASGRRVINEDEVMEFLKPLGFVSYSLEGKSFIEQVKLFSTAKNIIAPHGAGLTNMIFSPKNTTVIEFVTPWVSSGYFVPSQILGFQHGCLECHQSYSQKIRETRGDLIVDITNLKSLVEQFNLLIKS